ncbi:Sodium/potassium-transporting ATPase subunit alpha-3 [Gracilariopsis chorda]|uniref:Sodium/potassium-transporting ATPase subunit alpha-3 n=1 Tax=Gracilariopsis chorda TaxID=448386 RepID=A0A2V3IH88_9FLOR|nr:Sodium/potassium-transporting ATPase subunit alpha-3 [Gracilariopsis chorda]|eukprot:PXF41383.1 Sodium/potassium-transporting ATPase subunit alpha-3 [Gracilariopsis chorda]
MGRDDITPGQPRRLSHNELEMARQYSETSARISEIIERRNAGKKETKGQDDLKKELEMWEHKVSVSELCSKLHTDPEKGISEAEAKIRLERDGPNMLSPPKVTPWYVKLLWQFLNFFALLLQVASILCFVGYGLDREAVDNLYLGIVLYCVVVITAIFTFLQEFKSEKTMEKFKNFLPPKSVCRRGGKIIEVDASTLVVGDIIDVKLGDKIPADIRLVSNQKLKVDNSPLTGESEPIGRTVDCTDDNPLETKNLAFFGTLAVDGTCTGVVVNTGDDTVFGRIAGLAAGSVSEVTTLQVDIHHFVIIISSVAIFLGVLFFIIGLIKGTPVITNVVFCIGIIVANVPEGLLATVTVSLTLSAKRMAKKQVLVKKLEAVETLGSTTCICSDKTGTLTQNRMTIVHVAYDKQLHTTKTAATEATLDLEDPCFKELFFIGACCGKAVFDAKDMEEFPDKSIDERKVNGDASEAGILKFSEKIRSVSEMRNRNKQVCTIPFNSANKFMITINKVADQGERLRILMKGAPERVMDRCTTILTKDGILPFDDAAKSVINEQLAFMMERGERCLGFARLDLDPSEYPVNFAFDTEEINFPMNGLTFVGLMALLDPPREAVPDAVATCQTAGVKVIMVTGDHPATAKSIAKQVNIIQSPTAEDVAKERGIPVDEVDRSDIHAIVVPGSQIKDLEQDDWDRILAHDQIVFARTSPQQKLIIVENNQRLGNIVAVTGDGVNDSPALKKANIGIAMGISGSDVSKEAADMILLDDNFASIVNGVEEGRLIFDNLKKSIAYTLTSNIPEITPFLAFIIVQIPLPLTTVLILCIDLGTDLLPAISLAYENPESDIMRRPPRDSRVDRLVNRRLISFSYFQIGVIQALAGFYCYLVVLGDFGLTASILPFLDEDAYIASPKSEDKRFMIVERKRQFGKAESGLWFDEDEFSRFFKEEVDGFEKQSEDNGLEFKDLIENEDQRANMFKIIGNVRKTPPCLAFTCQNGAVSNDFSCFSASSPGGVTVTIDALTNEDRGNEDLFNDNVEEGEGDGQGCFDVYTKNQQSEGLKTAQTAFFVCIVIVQMGGLLVCKTRLLSFFKQGMKNWILNLGLLTEVALCALLCYVPFINTAFQTRSLRFVHWLPAIPFSVFIFCYDELRKFGIRLGDDKGNKFGIWLRDNTYW